MATETITQQTDGSPAQGADELAADRGASAVKISVSDIATYASANITDGSIANADLANMNAYTIKMRNNVASGVPEDQTVTDLTEETTPTAGDFLIGWESGGAIRKFDIGDLPTSVGITSFNVDGDNILQTITDGEEVLIAGGTGIDTVAGATDTVTVNLADMAANTVKVRNAGTTGVPQDQTVADFTEELTPAAGDFLLGWESGGAIRKFDVGDLPTGSGITSFTIDGDNNVPQTITDGEEALIAGGTGISTVASGAPEKVTIDHDAHTGDVTGATNLTIVDEAVTLAKLAHIATDSFLGRDTAATGDVEVLTPTLARGILNVADGANNYSHPNHSGDVTSTGDGATVIANDAVSNAKAANMAAATIKCRYTASTGDPEDATPDLLTEEVTPAAGHFLLGWDGNLSSSNLRKFDVGDLPSGGGSMTSFNIDGDNNAPQTISDGEEALIAGGTGISTTASAAPEKVTIDLTDMAANTLKGNNTGVTAAPTDVSVGTNSVVGRVAGNIVAAQLVEGQVADEAITLPKMAHIATDSFLGRDTAATGDVEVLTPTLARGILNVENGSTADQTDGEIETAYNNQVGAMSQVTAETGTSTTVERVTAQRITQNYKARDKEKSITIEDPTASENIAVWFTNRAITIKEIQAVVVGTGSPSVTIDPFHNTSRAGAGGATDILSTATAITNTTTGQNLTTFNDATVPIDSYIILATTAQSGTTVTELHVTFIYDED